MKSINQFFGGNPSLKKKEEVIELIAYCRELEAAVIEYEQTEWHNSAKKISWQH